MQLIRKTVPLFFLTIISNFKSEIQRSKKPFNIKKKFVTFDTVKNSNRVFSKITPLILSII